MGMIIPTFPSLATALKRIDHRVRSYLHIKYGWNTVGEDFNRIGGREAVDCEAANFQQRILPNGKTYSQSDTIDKMVFGVHGLEFETRSPLAWDGSTVRSDGKSLV